MTVFTALLPAIQALPQADKSAVDGVVRDPTGAVVPGCIVTLTRAGTGGKTTTLTNEEGVFVFPSVSTGSYGLQVVKEGFRTFEMASFRVTVGSHASMDVSLVLGMTSETLVVDAVMPGDLKRVHKSKLLSKGLGRPPFDFETFWSKVKH